MPRQTEKQRGLSHVSRRDFLRALVAGGAGLAGAGATLLAGGRAAPAPGQAAGTGAHAHGVAQAPPKPGPGMVHGTQEMAVVTRKPDVPVTQAQVEAFIARPFDPVAYATEFDYGKVSRLPDGRTLREYTVVSVDKEIEVAKGVKFPAWTFNGTVPGTTIRATEGDLLRIHYVNHGSHPHTIHFHGFHASNQDGVFEVVAPGGSYTYEFTAEPFGLHLYHCHTMPVKKHIHKGLYGVFIVDPRQGRPPAREFVMVMNGFDTDFDGENEFYAVNTLAFAYQDRPLRIRKDELVRVYLVNLTEFDLLNSMHIHGNFFKVYRTGTRLEPDEFTDNLILGQGERAILEFAYRFPGRFMFHAHQSEFAELGWMGMFEVTA